MAAVTRWLLLLFLFLLMVDVNVVVASDISVCDIVDAVFF